MSNTETNHNYKPSSNSQKIRIKVIYTNKNGSIRTNNGDLCKMVKIVFYGVTAGLFAVGDGLYLDRRRRTATEYKKKVKARRTALADETKIIVEPKITLKSESTKIP